jgi:hypothetical protein
LSPLLLVAILHNKFEDATSSGSFWKCDQISKGNSENYVVNPKRGDQYSPLLVDSLPLRQKKAEANLDIRQQRIPETVSQDAAG